MEIEERKRLVSKVASFIYATAVLNQGDSSCHVYLDEIEQNFGKEFFPDNWRTDIDLLIEIQTELCSYPGCDGDCDTCWLDINGYDEYGEQSEKDERRDSSDDAFNMCLFTNYIACDYDAD